ncbi:MAG TPA: ADOP family duplicated permease [Thermoanaerobaculia bacterium]|nr:ADOP family duplicated permease [Thermoanaerobaculia bacterium]
MSGLLHDLRDGLRAMRRFPGVTASSIAILGLAICANAVILTVAETIFFRPLPVPSPEGLARVYRVEDGREDGAFSYPEYRQLRNRAPGWQSLAAHYSFAPLVVDGPGGPREAQGAVVSENYFDTLGVRPALGRFFLPSEDSVPDRDPVAVLSDRYWRERFGADASVLGRIVRINGVGFTVVGVAPAGFEGVHAESPNDLWIPTMMLRTGYRWGDALAGRSRALEILGRIAPGRTLDQVRSGLAAVAPDLDPPGRSRRRRPSLVADRALGLEASARREMLPSLRLLAAIALLLLVAACANIAALQAVRAAARRKDLAIRRSIGCSPRRLVRRLLVESLLLAAAGGAAGIVLSAWARAAVLPFYTADSEGYVRAFPLALTGRVWSASLLLALVGGLLCGILPAIQATRSSLLDALKDDRGWTGTGKSRHRGILVGGQIALSFALVAAAGLLARSASRIRSGGTFDPSHVALMRLRPRLAAASPEKAEHYTREVVRRLEALPGVESVSLARGSGFAWRQTGEAAVAVPGGRGGRGARTLRAGYHEIGPGFLRTLGVPVLRGREFDAGDRAGAPLVALVNESLAEAMGPGADPLGRTVVVEGISCTVVGVFRDSQLHPAARRSPPFFYLAYWQFPFGPPIDSRIVVRVGGDPKAMLERLRETASAVDPNVPVTEVITMADQVSASMADVFLASRVASSAGLVAVLLAAIGLYGLLSAMLLRRRPEFALRLALGAEGSDIRALVARDAFRLVVVGIAAGSALALFLTRAMNAFLFESATLDARAFASSAAVLGAAALAACWPPARRAGRVDPAAALRAE